MPRWSSAAITASCCWSRPSAARRAGRRPDNSIEKPGAPQYIRAVPPQHEARGGAAGSSRPRLRERFIMAAPLLMPKATAVWLVDNTALSFDQIAAFCSLHPLEVQGVADGDVAGGIMGVNPIQNGQLTREEIEKAEADPNYRMKLSDPKV